MPTTSEIISVVLSSLVSVAGVVYGIAGLAQVRSWRRTANEKGPDAAGMPSADQQRLLLARHLCFAGMWILYGPYHILRDDPWVLETPPGVVGALGASALLAGLAGVVLIVVYRRRYGNAGPRARADAIESDKQAQEDS